MLLYKSLYLKKSRNNYLASKTNKNNEGIKETPPKNVTNQSDKLNLVKDDKYYYSFLKERNPGLSFGPDINITELKEMLTSKDFRKYLDSLSKIKSISRIDTVKYLDNHLP